jgi:uncharacterized repeat protein (TIGR03803 family)
MSHQSEKFSSHASLRTTVSALVFMFALVFIAPRPALAQSFAVLHSFSGQDGAAPFAGLTMDKAGNLYGTTYRGGTHGYGTVFKLVRKNSSWVLMPLYSFQNVPDGARSAARVVFGPDGSLYGTTIYGGQGCRGIGCGTVFRLTPPATFCRAVLCPWTETVLYRFGGLDGASPYAEVVFDQAGNLYGTTYGGGADEQGLVYELVPSGGGWSERVLYSFTGGADGASPLAGLIFDEVGNLYGTASAGGLYGTVYKLTRSGSIWTEDTLYGFQNESNGGAPSGGLIFDQLGRLYGTATYGGSGNGGTVFQLTPSDGTWTFNLVYALAGNNDPGPMASLTLDAAGNLYGTTYQDGAYGFGAVFKLTPSGGGWTYTSLHDFTGSDGWASESNVTIDATGNLYGTAAGGGANGDGVIWEITP